jgi:glyoxylase-like metal-dependent hydrolase (beta-lactamase superfamily II)
MIEKVMKNIYRIPVILPRNPLRELNAYYIRGGESDLLIDTGFNLPECRAALSDGLEELKADRSKLNILGTHLHSDHIGLAPEFVGQGKCLYLGSPDCNILSNDRHWESMDVRFLAEGFPASELESLLKTNPARVLGARDKFFCYKPLRDKDELTVGDYELKIIQVPGHTPGNLCLWMAKERVMFTGDHVLFDITPNITAWPMVEDSLGDYLDSLRRIQNYPVERAFPGHRSPGNYHFRIDELLTHHDIRINEVFSTVRDTPGLNAYEIAGRMTWQIKAKSWSEFPVVQKWFAVGECMSHLDYLTLRDRLCWKADIDGIRHYFTA